MSLGSVFPSILRAQRQNVINSVDLTGSEVTVQARWVELVGGRLRMAGVGSGGYVIYRVWIREMTSPPLTAVC